MMIHHLRAQLDAFRLGVHQRALRGREQDALARLGKMTLGEGGTRVGRLAALATEAAADTEPAGCIVGGAPVVRWCESR